MTGLLLKDGRILQKQSRFFLAFVLFYGVFLLGGGSEYSMFMTCYLTFVFAMFSISSFSYDEYDNSMAFLLTLPIKRKDYVKEKYVFSFLMSGSGWLLSMLMLGIYFLIKKPQMEWPEMLSMSLVYLAVVLFFQGYSLPLIFRYGAEKGRMVSFGILGGVFVFVFLLGISGTAKNVIRMTEELFLGVSSFVVTVAVLIILLGIYLGISYGMSVKFFENREF